LSVNALQSKIQKEARVGPYLKKSSLSVAIFPCNKQLAGVFTQSMRIQLAYALAVWLSMFFKWENWYSCISMRDLIKDTALMV